MKITDLVRPIVQERTITALTGGGAGKLDGIATVALALSPVPFVMFSLGGALVAYILRAGVDAEVSPTIIRPDDFNAGTNQKVWERFNFTTGAPLLIPDGTLAAPGLAFASENGMGLYRNAANDLRAAIAGSDFLVFNFVTASGATATPSLGIGTPPLRGGLHIKCPNTLLSGSGIQLENTDGTNGNATGVSLRCTTTGGGGAAMTELAKVSCTFVDHAHATRTSWLGFLWTDSSTARLIRFTGNNIITSDTGPVTLSSGSGNADVNLLPNGTGKIVFGLANQMRITSGGNQQAGDAVLVAGTVTVANTTISANTRIWLTRKVIGGTPGNFSYTLNAGVGFTINSDNAADTSTVNYYLIDVS